MKKIVLITISLIFSILLWSCKSEAEKLVDKACSKDLTMSENEYRCREALIVNCGGHLAVLGLKWCVNYGDVEKECYERFPSYCIENYLNLYHSEEKYSYEEDKSEKDQDVFFSSIVNKIKGLFVSSNDNFIDDEKSHESLITTEAKPDNKKAISSTNDNSQKDLTFTDSRDGQTYKTVKIGNTIWMAENLNYMTRDSYCYNDNHDFCEKYGRLYNWNSAIKVCPTGWKLPSNGDWEELKSFAENVAGMSKAGIALQKDNSIGFKAQLAGDRVLNEYKFINETGYYWSSTEEDETHAYDWIFSTESADLNMGNIKYAFKKNFMSVRCISK